MSDYVFRLLDSDGNLSEEFCVPCADDMAALDEAGGLSCGRVVEIWLEDRLLTRMKPNGEALLDPGSSIRSAA